MMRAQLLTTSFLALCVLLAACDNPNPEYQEGTNITNAPYGADVQGVTVGAWNRLETATKRSQLRDSLTGLLAEIGQDTLEVDGSISATLMADECIGRETQALAADTIIQDILDECLASTVIEILDAAEAAWRPAAIAHFNDKALEPNVVEAVWAADYSFWISMEPDGSSRDGYAEYVCLILHQNGKPMKSNVVISVWDSRAMSRGEMVKQGEHLC